MYIYTGLLGAAHVARRPPALRGGQDSSKGITVSIL